MARATQKVDEPAFVRKKSDAIVVDFAQLKQLILKDLNDRGETTILRKYKKEDVYKFLDDPQKWQSQLREISFALYNQSGQYKRLIHYFADMLTLDYIVVPNVQASKSKPDSLQRSYYNTLDRLRFMNIKHEFGKMLTIAFRDDTYCGYIMESEDKYQVFDLPFQYCQPSSTEDGTYNFAFDLSFFDGRNNSKLKWYPKEFTVLYNRYKANKTMRWQELSAENTICIKVNEDLKYSLPPFVAVFADIFDLRDFKALRKTKEKIGNYKLIIQEIPVRDKTDNNNDYMITLDHVKMFHNRMADATPDEVGVVTTPMKTREVSFDKDTGAVSDKVAQAERDAMSTAGVSQLVFNSDKQGAIGLDKSVIADESMMFKILRQIERVINRKLKYFDKKFKYAIKMPDLTVYNRDAQFDKYHKASTFGYPTKLLAGASLGFDPAEFEGMLMLENEMLGLPDKMIPTMSAHTQAGDSSGAGGQGKAGAPKKPDGKASDSAIRSRDKQTDKAKSAKKT